MKAGHLLNIPLCIVSIENEEAMTLYEASLCLVRPDQHVAWRGSRFPFEPKDVLQQAIGFNLGSS